jgi:hypothetical protein
MSDEIQGADDAVPRSEELRSQTQADRRFRAALALAPQFFTDQAYEACGKHGQTSAEADASLATATVRAADALLAAIDRPAGEQ